MVNLNQNLGLIFLKFKILLLSVTNFVLYRTFLFVVSVLHWNKN